MTDDSPRLHVPEAIQIPYDDVYMTFTHSQLLTGTEEIIVAPDQSRALTGECFLALSTTYFGLRHHEKPIMAHGLLRYGAAIQTVHETLANNDASQSLDVLEAVIIMTVIEVCLTSPTANGL